MEMSQEDPPTEPIIHFRCTVKLYAEYIPEDESLDLYSEQDCEEIKTIIKKAIPDLYELISRHLDLFYFLPQEQLILILNFHSTKLDANQFKILLNDHVALYTKSTSHNHELDKLNRKIHQKTIIIKQQLMNEDDLVRIMAQSLSPLIIQIRLYMKQPDPEQDHSSYWNTFINSVEQILNFRSGSNN